MWQPKPWEESHGMVHPENIHSGYSNSHLAARSERDHCAHDYLHRLLAPIGPSPRPLGGSILPPSQPREFPIGQAQGSVYRKASSGRGWAFHEPVKDANLRHAPAQHRLRHMNTLCHFNKLLHPMLRAEVNRCLGKFGERDFSGELRHCKFFCHFGNNSLIMK